MLLSDVDQQRVDHLPSGLFDKTSELYRSPINSTFNHSVNGFVAVKILTLLQRDDDH